MMMSVGSWMMGSGTSSIRTSRIPCQVAARMVTPLAVVDLGAPRRSVSRYPSAMLGMRTPTRQLVDAEVVEAGGGEQGGGEDAGRVTSELAASKVYRPGLRRRTRPLGSA